MEIRIVIFLFMMSQSTQAASLQGIIDLEARLERGEDVYPNTPITPTIGQFDQDSNLVVIEMEDLSVKSRELGNKKIDVQIEKNGLEQETIFVSRARSDTFIKKGLSVLGRWLFG